MQAASAYPFSNQGLRDLGNGQWSFRLYAPAARQVALVLSPDGEALHHAMAAEAGGHWSVKFTAQTKAFDYALDVDGHAGLFDPWATAATKGAGDLLRAQAPDIQIPPYTQARPMAVEGGTEFIYECHLRGYTIARADIAAEDRGTFRAWHDGRLAQELVDQGYTAVEFLPLHAFESETRLAGLGLTNYWGYNSLGFLVPEPTYGTAMAFRQLVEACHRAGLKVLVDVVYNHTAESDHEGPIRCFKAFAQEEYYRMEAGQPGRYQNPTGTGNSLNSDMPAVQALVHDSLIYWHTVLGVDGFRFDLAPTLARNAQGHMGGNDLLDQIATAPALNQALLIAEPWDIGPDGYQLDGHIFSPRWRQWNDGYRDAARRLIAEPRGALQAFARQLVGPGERVSFVCAHDGFTLQDLVSYNERHNWANGEDNRDGHGHNISHNHGHEGPSDDPAIIASRLRARRFFIALLLISSSTPMMNMGDELGRTQGGNNNGYCQDNTLSWVDWTLPEEQDLRGFVRQWAALRRQHLAQFIAAPKNEATIQWLAANGQLMQTWEWESADLRALTMVCGCIAVSLSLNGANLQLPKGFEVLRRSDEGVAGQPGPYVQLAIKSA